MVYLTAATPPQSAGADTMGGAAVVCPTPTKKMGRKIFFYFFWTPLALAIRQ
jgi:hypothetical protein